MASPVPQGRGGTTRRPTGPQLRALAYLDHDPEGRPRPVGWFSWPAQLGDAIYQGPKAMPSQQGLGRLGGTMGARLCRLGWASRWDRGYAITPEGRRVLAEHAPAFVPQV